MQTGALRIVIAVSVLLGLAVPAAASGGSLYAGSGPRPGPDLLYSAPAVAPQLTNAGPWKAPPILVSGATAYRDGEFLYQDYLYDDHGAREAPDPSDPKAAGNLFSKANGTYTYPTDSRYANNAADLVEFRVRPLATATAFRVTLNTLEDPSLVAFSVAIGGKPGELHPFPYGANASAPADMFLTVHRQGGTLVGNLVRANGQPVAGAAPAVALDRSRRQVEVTIPHSQWDPGASVVRLAAATGLWDAANGRYLVPQAVADSTHPGGAGTATNPTAFFNVAFRTAEPQPSVTEGLTVVTSAAWWRDRAQGTALAAGDLSPFYANVDFGKLARKVTDNSAVPATGPLDRILPSHFETAQGADFSQNCLSQAATCPGQYRGRLQPYAIYVPTKPQPAGGFGMTLLLHSLSANYNQYLATRNQSQLGERGPGSIVITPEARGPDESYENYGAADVFDVWADVARHYRLNPDWTDISGYSMGGLGTLKLGSQFPDLFGRAHSVVGFETNTDVLASLRNVPVLMWNNSADELANPALYQNTANKLDSLGYPYELDVFQPCVNAGCTPLFPNHLELSVNDQYAPSAAFLGTSPVDRNPAHVTYVVDSARNHPELGLSGDHAYWLSGLTLASSSHTGATGDPEGQIDAQSLGFGTGDPTASPEQLGSGTLTGGNLGPLAFARRYRTLGPTPPRPAADELDITATNIASATVDVRRAHLDCAAAVRITSDGPITVTLAGCGRTVQASAPSGPVAGLPALP